MQNLLSISFHGSFSENYLLSVLEFSENANLLFSEKPIPIVPLERTNISTMKLIKLEFSVNIQAKNVFTYFFLIRKCDI